MVRETVLGFRTLADDMSEILYQHDHITVWYHPEWQTVHHQVHHPARGEVFRRALSAGVACIRAQGATKWLSDDRLHFVLPSDDQQWATEEWFPAARAAGWKYWAIAKPEKAVADLFLRRVAAGYSAQGVTTELFEDPDAGLAWLKSIDSERCAKT
jgi:hypothetical protein